MNRYYFQELCEHLREELVEISRRQIPKRRFNKRDDSPLWEGIDYYLNVHNFKQTIPEWLRVMSAYRYLE